MTTRNLVSHQTDRYIVTVDNTKEGWVTIKSIRSIFKGLGRVTTKGRNPNRQQYFNRVKRRIYGNTKGNKFQTFFVKTSLRSDIPLKWSKTIDLYCIPSHGTHYNLTREIQLRLSLIGL
jgi:hypothetical protein